MTLKTKIALAFIVLALALSALFAQAGEGTAGLPRVESHAADTAQALLPPTPALTIAAPQQ